MSQHTTIQDQCIVVLITNYCRIHDYRTSRKNLLQTPNLVVELVNDRLSRNWLSKFVTIDLGKNRCKLGGNDTQIAIFSGLIISIILLCLC
jgi:hypothetical protein